MHRDDLAAFLRARRDVLSPEDVGMTRGPRRRTPGLRREELAMLAGISTDYLNRIEQSRGARPSEQVLGSLARGRCEHSHLALTRDRVPLVHRPDIAPHLRLRRP
jgi:transcriptional regulator with XRE-family HTH domain